MAGREINTILIIFIILAIVGICGCITIKEVDYEQYLKDSNFYRPSLTPTPTEGGTGSGQMTEIPPNRDGKLLNTAIDELNMLNSEGLLGIDTGNLTFYQVIGTGVGIKGHADSWVFGTRQNGQNLLFSYGKWGWSDMSWPGPLTEEKIDLEKIISPEDLFSKNSDVITRGYMEANVSYSDLFLRDGVYTIAIRDGKKIIELKFKADTGELI